MKLAKTITLHGKEFSVPVTLADRVVNYFDPVSGAMRYKSRVAMALGGGYQAADKTRRANQSGSKREMDADSAILPDLQTLREESQNLLRNSAIAAGAIKTNVTKVVGTGLKVKSAIDRDLLKLTDEQADEWEYQAEREYRLATETREIDAERQLPFSLLQGLIFLKSLEDGDLLVNMPRFKRPGSPYSLKLQLIEAARICNKDGVPDTPQLVAGVKKDATGEPIEYQVCNQHPGSRRYRRDQQQLAWTHIPAFGARTGDPLCLHLFDKTRPGQTRGVPYLAPVVEQIKQLSRYTDAEIMAAVVSGMLTVFVTSESGQAQLGPAPTQDNPDGDASLQTDTTGMELGYGSVLGLLPGEKVESVNPGRPNPAFDPFMQAILRQIGVALELPFELLIKHFTASYSAARAAMLEAWSYFNRRRHWLVSQLCQPVYEAVITEAVATGRLTAPGFFTDPLVRRAWLGTSWLGDAAGQIDPLKEINAAAARVELTVSSLDEESRKLTGTPWEDKLPQIIKERRYLRENNIAINRLQFDQDTADDGGSDLETS
jgi:lambda family phage portal protein